MVTLYHNTLALFLGLYFFYASILTKIKPENQFRTLAVVNSNCYVYPVSKIGLKTEIMQFWPTLKFHEPSLKSKSVVVKCHRKNERTLENGK